MLREAGVDAEAAHAADLAPYGRRVNPDQAVILLSHTAKTGYSMEMLTRAREAGGPTILISGIGAGGDLETVAVETSYAYTASHTGALTRLAQLATLLGAELGPLEAVPDAVGRALEGPGPLTEIPQRLVEIIGTGPNSWTAQEAALKIREASTSLPRGCRPSSSFTVQAWSWMSATCSSFSTVADQWPSARTLSPPQSPWAELV